MIRINLLGQNSTERPHGRPCRTREGSPAGGIHSGRGTLVSRPPWFLRIFLLQRGPNQLNNGKTAGNSENDAQRRIWNRGDQAKSNRSKSKEVLLQQRVFTIEQLQRRTHRRQENCSKMRRQHGSVADENLWLTEIGQARGATRLRGRLLRVDQRGGPKTLSPRLKRSGIQKSKSRNRNRTRRTWQYSHHIFQNSAEITPPPAQWQTRPVPQHRPGLPLRWPRRGEERDLRGGAMANPFETCSRESCRPGGLRRVAVVLFLVGVYVPGSPIARERTKVDSRPSKKGRTKLNRKFQRKLQV